MEDAAEHTRSEKYGQFGDSTALAFLDSVMAHGPVGYALLDRQFRYVAINERLIQINGVTREAHLGRSVAEVLGPTLWESRRSLFERVLEGEAVEDVELAGPADPITGRQRQVLACYYPVRTDMGIIGVALAVRDQTEQAQAAASLAAKEREYRLLFDLNPQPMWVYETHTLRFLDVNQSAVEKYGYSRAEFLAMTLRDIRFAEDVPAVLQAVAQAVDTPRAEPFLDGPWRHRRKNGSLLWVEIAASNLDFRGQAARLVVAHDITDRVLMEQERQDAAQRQYHFLRDMLASVTENRLRLCSSRADLPLPLAPLGDPILLLPAGSIRDLRCRASHAAAATALSEERAYDLEIAVGEVAMNAIVHGGGGQGRVCVSPEGVIQVWVEDAGAGISLENLPQATLKRGFTTANSLGHGLKMTLQTVDRTYLLTGPTGTVVVLEQDRVSAIPDW